MSDATRQAKEVSDALRIAMEALRGNHGFAPADVACAISSAKGKLQSAMYAVDDWEKRMIAESYEKASIATESRR